LSPSRSLPALRLAVASVLALTVAGCTDYLARRDTLILETGDALQHNSAVHVVDPWPRHAQRIERETNGERLQRGIERYRNPAAAEGGGGGVPIVPTVPPGVGGVPSVR